MPVRKNNKRAIVQFVAPPAVDGHARCTNKLVLVLNAGSSSLKISLFEGDAPLALRSSGVIDRLGSTEVTFTAKGISD